jgi:hypothetical protein
MASSIRVMVAAGVRCTRLVKHFLLPMKISRIFAAVFFLCLCTLPDAACADSAIRTPATGTSERKAIMDALREPVQTELHQQVIFKIRVLRVTEEWAFLDGQPLRADGSPVDYRKTRYQERIRDGYFDNGITALLSKRQGHWKVVTYSIGHTDVVYSNWDQEFGAPRGILGP